jgi:exonuclease VII large subunit
LIAFDVLQGFAAMLVHNFDVLVTKDYLDTRFAEFEARLGRELDRRFAEVDQRFSAMQSQMDQRFAAMESRMDKRFVALESSTEQRSSSLEARMEQRYADLEARMQLGFAQVETRFARVNVMLGIIMAALALPVLQTVLLWVGPAAG